jgi:hypothetical protein
MGVTIPPESQSQLASSHDEGDPHESVTIAPPAPNFDELLRYATPVPSASNHGDQPFRAALDAGSRAGSSLTELSKIVSELSRGLAGARQANERLVHELGVLQAMLGSADEQQLSLRHRAAQLEQELMLSQSAAERERQYLTEQHDAFLAAILEEHDAEGVRAREALAKAEMQRDEARARAEKRERERDELRAEASQLRARLGTHRSPSTVPPPPVTNRPPSFRPVMLQLDTGELDSTLHTRSPSPRLPSALPRLPPPPAELALARDSAPPVVSRAEAFPHESTRPGVGGPKPSEPPPPPSFGPPPSGWTPPPPAPEPSQSPRPVVISAASLPPGLPSPALKQKPDPSTRPLIDYSLGGDRVSSETLEGARLSSKPPRK